MDTNPPSPTASAGGASASVSRARTPNVEEKGEPKPTTAPEPETEPASVSELASASEARASGPGPAPAPASGSASGVATGTDTPVAGPSAPKRIYSRKPTSTVHKPISGEGFMAYTSVYNVKNPAGEFVQRESNVEVVRQMSQARLKREREAEAAAEAEAEGLKDESEGASGGTNGAETNGANANGDATAAATPNANGDKKGDDKKNAEGEKKDESNPLDKILVIHPGSRNLRLGRASDFYPHEVPNCIARPPGAEGRDPPVLGKRSAEEEFDTNIGYLRDYLRNRLRQGKLTTDSKEGQRVKATNARAKPENISEHNDSRRIDWTELEGNRPFLVGNDALRLPTNKGWRLRYPILQRKFNTRDWSSHQLLLDDFTTILQESLRTELGIKPIDYKNYSVVLIVPDHGDRAYVEQIANILFMVMGFKEIAVHQESYCAIFSAGMSSACVVDIGAQETSVTCVDEGVVNSDTRITLNYGGDDVTIALKALLERSSFPYKDLDLARPQDWLMLDELKMRVCTLEEHLVANTPWEFYVLSEGPTQKFLVRTYDENVLAPLCFFDTRMIDFDTKKLDSQQTLSNPNVDDLIKSHYAEPTGAMKACTAHLFPSNERSGTPAAGGEDTPAGTPAPHSRVAPSATPVPNLVPPTTTHSAAATPGPDGEAADEVVPKYDITYEASKTPLDGAIAASISLSASENKVKTAANSILLVGGGSALNGLAPFISDRLPSLLRQRGLPIQDVSIIPPPRNLNPKFVSWKGASVMCNLEGLSDMWIRRDEFEAIGVRSLKDRCLFL